MGTVFLLGGVMKISALSVKDAQFCEYTKNHQNVHFKMANLMVCELHLYFFKVILIV